MHNPIKIGISGWTYPPWRGDFYPKGLKIREELAYAASKVDTIEVNGTFYRLQTPKSFQHWFSEVPEDFTLAIKGGRFITHIKRLNDVDAGLANFFASGILALGKKLGPILWQLPPTLPLTDNRVADFLVQLPKDGNAAVELARNHTEKLDSPYLENPQGNHKIRHALEVRHASYLTDAFLTTLHEHGVALVIADSGGKWPYSEEITTDFVYMRLHGLDHPNGYSEKVLHEFAEKIIGWSNLSYPNLGQYPAANLAQNIPLDIFVYFDNDAKSMAPRNAMQLKAIIEDECGF